MQDLKPTYIDLQLPVLAGILNSLQNNILCLCSCVTGTLLPNNAFAKLTLVVSNYNTKLTLVRNKKNLNKLRTVFIKDFSYCQNVEHIDKNNFQVDARQKIQSTAVSTTCLCKLCCNNYQAALFNNLEGPLRTRVLQYLQASIDAGLVIVELTKRN